MAGEGHSILYWDPTVSTPCSLLILIHGGPHNLFHVSFNGDVAYYTKHGFAVLVPNYRGSAGFGEHYLHALCGHMGDVELADVLSAIDHVMEGKEVKVDPERVFAMGSSYGGYIVMGLVIRSTVVKVGVLWGLYDSACDSAQSRVESGDDGDGIGHGDVDASAGGLCSVQRCWCW